MGRDIKYLTKQYTRTYTHVHCTHTIWWLVLGWVTTKEDHPILPIEYNCIKCGSALAGMERVGGR